MSNLRTWFEYESRGDRLVFQPSGGYAINFPDGADGLAVSVSPIRNPDGIGGRTQSTTVPARPITITGYIWSDEPNGEIRRLQRAFSPHETGRLWACTYDQKRFFLDCRATSLPAVEASRRKPRFQVGISADYPYWQSDEEQTASFITQGQTCTREIDVNSDVPAVYRLQIVPRGADARGVRITDPESGEYLLQDQIIPNGSVFTVEIDQNGKIKSTLDGANVIRYTSCTMRKLKPGKRTLDIYYGGIDSSAEVEYEISYREARVGV